MNAPFATMSAAGRDRSLTAERLVNLYAETAPAGSGTPVVLRSAPGLAHFATVGQGPIRGMATLGEVLYAVSGDTLYRVDGNGAGTALGPIPGTGKVAMADNGLQLVVLDGLGGGHVWDGTGLAPIADPDFRPAASCAFLNQYIVFGEAGTGRFFVSALLDAKAYNALDFATAEARPDAIVEVYAHRNLLWLFGERSTEVWWNSGASTFPFERVSAGVLGIGAVAGSVAAVDASLYWLGDDGVVYRADGFQPVRVSTHAIEATIRGRTGVRAWACKDEGHAFYVLGSDQGAAVYDAATGLWHERESFTIGRWRADSHARAYGQNLVGDFRLGRIYSMSLDHHTDGGNALRRRAISAPVAAAEGHVFLPALELRFEFGAGLTDGHGADPQVVLDWSDDGGRNWSAERWAALGRIGEYRRRAVWRRLGRFRSRSFRLTCSEPVPFAIHGVAP